MSDTSLPVTHSLCVAEIISSIKQMHQWFCERSIKQIEDIQQVYREKLQNEFPESQDRINKATAEFKAECEIVAGEQMLEIIGSNNDEMNRQINVYINLSKQLFELKKK